MKEHPNNQRAGASTGQAVASDAWELGEFDPAGQGLDKLMEEINFLRLEGVLFCLDKKQAKKRTEPITIPQKDTPPIIIEPHPSYGQPSVLAYKVMQAIFIKMTMEGYPYPDRVSFTKRELARLVDRKWSGGEVSKQLHTAIMQLNKTFVNCTLHNKDTGEWEAGNFQILWRPWFAGRGKQLTMCSVGIDPAIVASINRRHVAYFNLHRLNTLDVIGMITYKRLFFHFSNIYRPGKTKKDSLTFCKDYEAICREWLGGLKPERYISHIKRKHLGARLDALKRTGIIRRCDIERKADGTGFKLTFTPGRAFFDDYEAYYLDQQQPRFRFKQTADLLDIQQPLEAVAYFHELLGHDHTTFDEKEAAYARHLLKEHSLAEVRDLIKYAVERAPETNYRMRWLNAITRYRDDWRADHQRQTVRKGRHQAIEACAHCNDQGMLLVKNRTGAMAVRPCPHDIEAINRYEEENDLRRV